MKGKNMDYKKITVEELDKLMASVPTNGTAWRKVGNYKDKELCLVLGWREDEPNEYLYQQSEECNGKTKTYTLYGKLAINVDSLQYDYDTDWAMPEVGGVVWDTDTAVTIEALDFWNNQAKELLER